MINRLRIACFIFAALVTSGARAEQFETFGDYTVHYSAFTTDFLSAEIAKSYGLARSKNRALLNVSILKKVLGKTGTPVHARVKIKATNPQARVQELNIRELEEPGAVYYLAELPVSHGETLTFNVEVTPRGDKMPYKFSFQQQFVTEY
jgi:Domain of unknown function (DUF4426)